MAFSVFFLVLLSLSFLLRDLTLETLLRFDREPAQRPKKVLDC